MSKELQALEEIRDFRYGEDKLLVCQTEMYSTIKKALQRLESIDNAKPSEAIKFLEEIEQNIESRVILDEYRQLKLCAVIKQALLKAQENEKVLSIIKEKRIDIESFYKTFIEDDFNYLDYQIMYGTYGLELLTQEEFDLLKRCLDEKQSK